MQSGPRQVGLIIATNTCVDHIETPQPKVTLAVLAIRTC
jgi:hypothetical protein